MNLASIFTKYNEKFNEIKEKYNNDYSLIADDPEYKKYSIEYANLIRVSCNQLSDKKLKELDIIIGVNDIYQEASKLQIVIPKSVDLPMGDFAFYADSQYSQFILQQKEVVKNIEEKINSDMLQFSLSLVNYESSIEKAQNEFNSLKKEIVSNAKESYKEACLPKESSKFYIDAINSQDCDEIDKNEFVNLVNLISSKIEDNQIDDELKDINKDPNFANELSSAKQDNEYDVEFILSNKETFIKLLKNEDIINILNKDDLNNPRLFSRDINRKNQIAVQIKKESDEQLNIIAKNRDSKINGKIHTIFEDADDDEFLKHGVDSKTLKNKLGDLIKQYQDIGEATNIVKDNDLTIGKNVVDKAKETFNLLINSSKDKNYPQGINPQNIHEIVKVISSLKINHENRPWYQKFFGYFFHVGDELREADRMAKKVAEMVHVERKLVDDAVKDTMLKKYLFETKLEDPEKDNVEAFVPVNEGARKRYLKQIDDYRLGLLNIDVNKKPDKDGLDILTHEIIKKQGIEDDIVVTEDDIYQQEYFDDGSFKFVDKELNITQETMRDKAIVQDLLVDFTTEDMDDIENFDFEKNELNGNEMDFNDIDNQYDFENEYVKREDIEAVKQNLEETKEMKISEINQYISNFKEEKQSRIDKFDTLDTNIQNLEPELLVDDNMNFKRNQIVFPIKDKEPTVVLKQEVLNKKLNEMFVQNDDSKEVSKSNTNAPVNAKDVVKD